MDPQFWQRRIAERLRGSTARHERADWVLPGLTAEASRAFEAFLPENTGSRGGADAHHPA